MLLPEYMRLTTCYLGNRGDCDSIAISLQDVVLEQRDFSISSKIDNLMTGEVDTCRTDSMMLILTDIPCSEIRNYPDMEYMFHSHWEDTLKAFNKKYYLHTIVYWLVPNDTQANKELWPCQDFITYFKRFDNTSMFLELRTVAYGNFTEEAAICDHNFPRIEKPDPKKKGMSKALQTGLIVGCSVVGVFLLCVALFFGYRVRKRYIESKLEFFADQHANRTKTRNLFWGPTRPMDEWEITPKELKVDASVVLGTGISATVYKGHMKRKRDNQVIEMDVAVKFAHSYADSATKLVSITNMNNQ